MKLKTNDTNDRLVAFLQQGDKLAFKILFEKYGTQVYQFSLRYLREKNDAEDLLNEVFLKIWENRHLLKTNYSFQSYLFTIAYNNIRQRFLKRNREEKYIRIFAEEYLLDSLKEEDHIDYLKFTKEINAIIELLPPRRKEIFNLNFKEGLKNREISEELGLSEQFVKKQLLFARKFIISKAKENNRLASILFLFLFIRPNPD